jgi:signal transduction histidine kinase/PAS domain-containing protein
MTDALSSSPAPKNRQRAEIWRGYVLFCIGFFFVMTLLTAFVVIPKLNQLSDKQHDGNLELELALEIELFMRFVQAQKNNLEDLAQFPSIANAVMLSDATDRGLIEFFDNIVIEGKKAKLVLQDISGTSLLQTSKTLLGSYQPNEPWQTELLEGNIEYYFKLLEQRGDLFTFKIAVPVLYNTNIEGIISAEITVPKNQAFATPSYDTDVAIRLIQDDITVQTSLENIEIADEVSKKIMQPELMFTYITDEARIIGQKNKVKNLILSVLLAGLVISFILFGLLGYLSFRDHQDTESKIEKSWKTYVFPLIVGLIGLAATTTAYFAYKSFQQQAYEAHMSGNEQEKVHAHVHSSNAVKWNGIFILISGFGLSTLITTSLISAMRQRRILEDTVKRRTASLLTSEQEIRDSKDFLELTINSIPSLIFVKDEELKLVQVNNNFLNLYPEDQRNNIIGYTTAEKYNKEEAEAFFKYDRIAFKEGYSDVTETIHFPDGKKRTIYTQKVRFENTAKEKFIIGIANDVTEYEAELALLQEMQKITVDTDTSFANKMTKILEAGCSYFDLPLGIISKIDDQKYTAIYTSDTVALKPGSSFDLGETYCAITYQQNEPFYSHEFSQSDHKAHPCFAKFKLETYIGVKLHVNNSTYGTLNFSSPDKQVEPFTERQSAMLNLISQWIGLKMAEHENLKDKNKLIDNLVSSNEELERFAFVCSHDLQEPLRMIRSFSELLQGHIGTTLENDEKGKKYFDFITDGAARAQVLIEDILTYSSIDSDTKILEKVDTEALITLIEKNMHLDENKKKGEISYNNLPTLTGNKTQLFQLFQNIINNGLKYQTPDKNPHVEISAKDVGQHWQFCVKDNGIGIEERHRTKIFDVFQRLHRKSDFAGTGIGLSICKKIVERHGGKIWVDSDKGNGSKFYFTILKPQIMEEKHGNKTS